MIELSIILQKYQNTNGVRKRNSLKIDDNKKSGSLGIFAARVFIPEKTGGNIHDVYAVTVTLNEKRKQL